MLRVVASHTDTLADAVADLARGRGWQVERTTHAVAALATSVEVAREGNQVFPDCALFLRPPLERWPDDDDEAFLQQERLAHLWAAAALGGKAVVNRPTAAGLWGRVTHSSLVTELRAGLAGDRTEVFCTNAGRRAWPGTWAAARPNGSVVPWPAASCEPVRARPIWEGEEYEAVVVVGERAWRMSDASLTHLALEEQTVTAFRRLELSFGLAWWAVAPHADRAMPVRFLPAPSFAEVAPRWPQIGQELLRLLS